MRLLRLAGIQLRELFAQLLRKGRQLKVVRGEEREASRLLHELLRDRGSERQTVEG